MESSFAGFTPVRRREDTISTWRKSTDNGKAWTTARCNRLLRPLISRVSALGKLLPSENLTTEKHTSTQRTKPSNTQDEDFMRDEYNDNDKDNDDEDGEWAPVRKKLKRTYSARLGKGTRGRPPKASKEGHNEGYSDIRHRMPFLVPGEISVPTPILNRTRGTAEQEVDLATSSSFDENVEGKRHKRPKSRYLTKDGEAHFELSEILRRLRRKTDSSRYTLYEGIYNGLEALLKATMVDSEPAMQDRKGVRSLFNTCLRKVPAVVKDEEEMFALETGDRSTMEARDISSEIYAELEALGHGDRGWKHLRTIVRAHGVQIVGDAITQGLVRPDFARALILLCVHTACLDEAEKLISCLLEVTTCPEPKSIHSRTCDESIMLPLLVLENFASYTGRRSFQTRQLTRIFIDERLPLSWLATKEFCRVWTHVIQSSTSDVDSVTFLTTLIPKLCSLGTKAVNFASTEGVVQKALDATLTSVLTALSAITLLDTEIPQASMKALQQPCTVLRQCLIACAQLPSPLKDHRTSLLAFSNIFTSLRPGTQDSFSTTDLFRKVSSMLPIKPTQKSNDSITSFICSVACCCGRGVSNTGFDHLKLLHTQLRKYLEHQSCPYKHSIREVIIDSAFSFARRHDELDHLDYAEDIESEFHGEHIADLPRRLPAESGGDVSSGFRWEEGISEWVTATPAFSLRKSAVIHNNHVDNDFDDSDSPLRHHLQRGKHLTVPRISVQVPKQVKPPSKKQEYNLRGAIHHRKPQQVSPDSPSESEGVDPLDMSLTSMASDNNNASFASSQSTESGESNTSIMKVGRGKGARVLRLRFPGLRNKAHWQVLDDDSDDELSSSTTSWNTSIKRNTISVVILQQQEKKAVAAKRPFVLSGGGGSRSNSNTRSHPYSTRRKSQVGSSGGGADSGIPRKRVAAVDDDSADELCQ